MDIFQQINILIDSSKGKPVYMNLKDKCYFLRHKIYNNQEIDKFEKFWKVSLPNDYKLFLTKVGACDLFVDEYGLGVKFHRLENLEDYSQEVFVEMKNPFPFLLLIVSLTGRGDDGGLDLSKKTDNFSVFSHEEDPEMWQEDTEKWIAFSEWLHNLVISEGENDLP